MAENKFEDVNGINMSNHPSGIVPTIQNIVSTVNLNCELDLETIALRAQNAKYNTKRFAGVIMRISDPKSSALLFSSGKLVCTGAKTEEQANLAAQKYTEIVQELGFPASFNDFKIQNIVGSCDVQFPIRLELLHCFGGNYGLFSRYDSKFAWGLICYWTVKPNIKMMIFASGKIVITGATVRQEIYKAFEDLYPIINRFKETTITDDLIKSNL